MTTGLLVGNQIMGGVQVNATGGTACLDATGNTLAPGQFDLEEVGGEISISHWEPAVKDAGLDGLSFHDLRRTNATAMVAEGVDVKTAQARLGHSDPRLTLAV